jgi:hypothetical protein
VAHVAFHHRWKTIARLAALLVLAVIVRDLCDRSCFDCDFGREAALVSSDAGDARDACAEICIPDCFCCATPSPAVTLLLAESLTVLDRPPAPPGRWVASGYPLIPEHIPIVAA